MSQNPVLGRPDDEEMLRVLGHELDRCQLRAIAVIELPAGVLLTGPQFRTAASGIAVEPVTIFLRHTEFCAFVTPAHQQRRWRSPCRCASGRRVQCRYRPNRPPRPGDLDR